MTSPVGEAKVAWQLVTVGDSESLARTIEARVPQDFWVLDHDPYWLASVLGTGHKWVTLAIKDGECFCGLFVHDMGLDLSLGEVSLGSIPVRRYVLTGGIPEKASTAEDLVALLCLLRKEGGPTGVVFLQGVHEDEPLRLVLSDPRMRRSYFVVPHGPAYQRCRIVLGGSYEAYLMSLKSKPRTDLRRIVRHFNQRFGSGIEYQVLRSEAEVEAALPELESLSAKTYQARMLGLGVTRGSTIEQQLRYGARAGMARLDLLRINGKLVSFSIGYVHRDVFYGIHRGYDAGFADSAPGIVHNSFIFEDVTRSVPPVRIVDLMYGESTFKLKVSNSHHRERHFYLIPRTPRGFRTWLTMRTVAGVSETAGRLATRFRHKAALARLIRRLVPGGGTD